MLSLLPLVHGKSHKEEVLNKTHKRAEDLPWMAGGQAESSEPEKDQGRGHISGVTWDER